MKNRTKIAGGVLKGFLLLSVYLMYSSDIIYAHRVNIFAWEESGKIYTASKFANGKRVINGKINIYNQKKELLLQGTTDSNGIYSFQKPGDFSFKIELLAGTGHRDEFFFSLKGTEKMQGDRGDSFAQEMGLTPEKYTKEGSIQTKELEKMIARIVSKEVAPIKKYMAESTQKKITLYDVISGLGYILGLVGVATYISARHKNSD